MQLAACQRSSPLFHAGKGPHLHITGAADPHRFLPGRRVTLLAAVLHPAPDLNGTALVHPTGGFAIAADTLEGAALRNAIGRTAGRLFQAYQMVG